MSPRLLYLLTTRRTYLPFTRERDRALLPKVSGSGY